VLLSVVCTNGTAGCNDGKGNCKRIQPAGRAAEPGEVAASKGKTGQVRNAPTQLGQFSGTLVIPPLVRFPNIAPPTTIGRLTYLRVGVVRKCEHRSDRAARIESDTQPNVRIRVIRQSRQQSWWRTRIVGNAGASYDIEVTGKILEDIPWY